jgi:hypothetical protein
MARRRWRLAEWAALATIISALIALLTWFGMTGDKLSSKTEAQSPSRTLDEITPSSQTSEPSRAEYISQSDKICRSTATLVRRIMAEYPDWSRTPNDPQAQHSMIIESVSMWNRLIPTYRASLVERRALHMPAKDRMELEVIFRLLKSWIDAQERWNLATLHSDVSAASSHIEQAQAISTRNQQRSKEYGFRICGYPHDLP